MKEEQRERLKELAERAGYGGNPEHKKNPGDFNLNPPSCHRQDKALCDEIKIFTRRKALELLKVGLRQGLVSIQERNGWPQNVWAVSNGRALQAMLENPEQGIYHGFPLPENDPLADEILKRWKGENE
ncbi:MAG: hypothetical protein PHE55_20170 [Methylococcaceae bacterium]|nr:hypothetical protein [Methylococcaceae bacterium]